MQRATYLATLYESVSTIPPDIQQCLLTIAQYGCDADQVRRWYNIVRHHFGVAEGKPPPIRMPPPRQARQKRPAAVPSDIRTPPSSSSRTSTMSFHAPVLAPTAEKTIPDTIGVHSTPVQCFPPVPEPWTSPQTSDGGGDYELTSASEPPSSVMGGYQALSPSLGNSMAFFTGTGLAPPAGNSYLEGQDSFTSNDNNDSKNNDSKNNSSDSTAIPFPYDFTMSRTAMPIFVRREDDAPRPQRVSTPGPAKMLLAPLAPLANPQPSPRGSSYTPEPPRKQQKFTREPEQCATWPIVRHGRSLMPYRANEDFPGSARWPQIQTGSPAFHPAAPIPMQQQHPAFHYPDLMAMGSPGQDCPPRFVEHSPIGLGLSESPQMLHPQLPKQENQQTTVPYHPQTPAVTREQDRPSQYKSPYA